MECVLCSGLDSPGGPDWDTQSTVRKLIQVNRLLADRFNSFATGLRDRTLLGNSRQKDTPARNQTVIFILSSPHSGSTWAGYVLGSHPQCDFVGEYYRCWQPQIRKPCPLCSSRGRNECAVLHGIDKVPDKDAFKFAFERFDKRVLVDNSKVLEWINRFSKKPQPFDVKAVHILRDPRGYYYSHRRRLDARAWPTILPAWLKLNIGIRDFLKRRKVEHSVVFYDDLAVKPEEAFRSLFAAMDLSAESPVTAYQNREHHAFAANGASYKLLRDSNVPFLVTGDDRFYSKQTEDYFHDQRWCSALTPEEKSSIQGNASVARFLKDYGKRMETNGLVEC